MRERRNHFLSTWGESKMRTGHNNITRTAQGQKVPQERQLFTAEENIYNVTAYFKYLI